MSLRCEIGLFHHVPKTGGMWMRKALEAAGVEYEIVYTKPTELPNVAELVAPCEYHHVPAPPEPGERAVSIHRPADDWYDSVWRFRTYWTQKRNPALGWRDDRGLDECQAETTEAFRANVYLKYSRDFHQALYDEYRSASTEIWPLAELTDRIAAILNVDAGRLPAMFHVTPRLPA